MSRYFNSELCHYGVIGMKWGVRKSSGYSKKEIKSDNKTAFELGRSGTIASRSNRFADELVVSTQKKLDKAKAKGKDTSKLETKLKINKETAKVTKLDADNARKAIDAHRDALISKYGSTHVSDIKLDKHGEINERISTGKQWAKSVVLSGTIRLAATAVGSPVALVVRPQLKQEAAIKRYAKRRRAVSQKYKGK